MSFNLNAIPTDSDHGLTLTALETRLRGRLASDPARSEMVHEPGAPPICPPHLRFIWRETDMGTSGEWFALLFLESGDDINDANRDHVASSLNRCPCPDDVRAADARVRVLFHDGPDREFTNTAIELMTFLDDLPSAVVYDPQQNKFST